MYSLASGGVSIAALFLAGYIPGILTCLFLMLVASIWAKRKGYVISQKSSVKEVFSSLLSALPSLLLLFIVIGGIVAGFFTATEASAVAVLYTLVLGITYKEIKFKDLSIILLESSIFPSLITSLLAIPFSVT